MERELLEVMALTALGGVCRTLLPDGGVGRVARFVLGLMLLTAAVSLFLPAAERALGAEEMQNWYAATEVHWEKTEYAGE